MVATYPSRFALPLLLAGIASGCTFVKAPRWPAVTPDTRTRSFPGGIADVTDRTAYLAAPGSIGIDAVDLETGTLRWHTDGALRPLLVLPDGRLVAQAATADLRIALLDPVHGRRLAVSGAIAIPSWSCIGPSEQFSGCDLGIEGRPAGATSVIVSWTSQTGYAGGAAPTPEMIAASTHEASGTVLVDLASGRVTPGGSPASAPVGVPPPGTLVPAAVGDRQTLVLETASGARVPLLTGREIVRSRTRDGAHLVVQQALDRAALPPGDDDVWIYRLVDGGLVAKIPREEGAGDFTVLGSYVFLSRTTFWGTP